MTAIIHRSWLVNMGGNPPPELAYIISDHKGRKVVTWAEMLENRRKAQRWRLERRRSGESEMHAYRLWVAYFDQDIYGGWHAFLDSFRPHDDLWIRRGSWLVSRVMRAFPLLLPLWSEDQQWERWKSAFAERYARRQHHGRPLGVAYVWWDGGNRLRPAVDLRSSPTEPRLAPEATR